MRKRILIGTVLLLSTATLGFAVAAGEVGFLDRNGHERHASDQPTSAGPRPTVLVSEMGEGDTGLDRDRRAQSDEDGDDEGSEDDAAGQSGPADPNAPVPDNGLFNGKAHPKAQVQ